MTDRIKRLQATLKVGNYPLSTERVQIMIPAYDAHIGYPEIVRRAHAISEYMDRRTIFIEPDELIVGNTAADPNGMEFKFFGPFWGREDWEDIMNSGTFTMRKEDQDYIPEINKFWTGRGLNMQEQQGFFYDDKHLWPFVRRGFLTPPWKEKTKGRGFGAAGCGLGDPPGCTALVVPDYAKFMGEGLEAQIEAVDKAWSELQFNTTDCCDRYEFYYSAKMVMEAFIRLAKRYSKLAAEMAEQEADPVRRNELLVISETCDRVPARPARTFREAVQAFWFFWIYLGTGTIPGGRFDQFMYPYYKADIEAGRITREEALELIESMRIKIMQFNYLNGGKAQRAKWAGMARWHNFIIGGSDMEGNDLTNELTYLLIESVEEVRTPQFTLTLRVHENTPKELMLRCMKLVASGIGMPAFVSEKSYISFLTSHGVPLKDAYDFAIAGCLDVQIPGRSRQNAIGMFLVPTIVELALYNGCEPKSGVFFGEATGEFTSFRTYEEFYEAFLKQLRVGINYVNEEHNVLLTVLRRNQVDPMYGVFQQDGIKIGRDVQNRGALFENASTCNVVGIINAVDSLAAIKKVVFDDRSVSAERLIAALRANWEGYEDVRRLCLEAPKFGNNDDYVDQIGVRLWNDISDICATMNTVYNSPLLPSAISITAHAPGGSIVSATPDGRYDGETFCDGSVSPMRGRDLNGPVAVLQSCMKLPQERFSATLLNMKFTPNSLKTDADKEKLGDLVKTYLTHGGKHVQFNVVDRSTLEKAQKDKEGYKDLIVRVAGYSSYFVKLTPQVQSEIMSRTAHEL